MQHLTQILANFTSITLSELDKVKLMNRVDFKYPFHVSLLPEVLEFLSPHYKVLEINSMRTSFYKSLYFDSEQYDLYHHHHNGKLNRYKIRHRTYTESDLSFLEIKFKNNKLRTIKNRIQQNSTSIQSDEASSFIKSYGATLLQYNLKPVLWVNYKRITLTNHQLTERLTLDTDLSFETETIQLRKPYLVIAELKQNAKETSPFNQLVKKFRLQEGGISKYCMGMALTHHQLKQNNFKQILHKLEKINNTYAITNS